MADDNDVVWLYNPSFALAVFATVVYSISFAWIFYLTVIKYRAWFFVCVVVGSAIEVVGYAIRCYSAKKQTEVGPFAATLSLIVLAPIFVAAGNYLLIGRIIRSVLPSSHHRIFRVPAHLLTRIFVICDIISFLIQCSGSGVASSNSWVGEEEKIGTKILIAGLSFQVFTFCAYLCIFGRFHYLARTMAVPEAPRGWTKVVTAVYVSSLLILVRSVYRVIEFAEGVWGYPFTHEWLFWVFEALPMIIAITIFCLYHPSKYLGRDGRKKEASSEEICMSDDARFAGNGEV